MNKQKLEDNVSRVRRELIAFKLLPYGPGVVGGVCAAIAYRLAIPTWIVRMTLFLLVLCSGIGLIPYLLLWIFVPNTERTPSDYTARTGDSV